MHKKMTKSTQLPVAYVAPFVLHDNQVEQMQNSSKEAGPCASERKYIITASEEALPHLKAGNKLKRNTTAQSAM